MPMKSILTGLLVSACILGPATADGALTVTSYGGNYQHSQDETFFKPFAKATGLQVQTEEYNGEIAKSGPWWRAATSPGTSWPSIPRPPCRAARTAPSSSSTGRGSPTGRNSYRLDHRLRGRLGRLVDGDRL